MAKSRLIKQNAVGTFAGFKSPRYLAVLPTGTIKERKERYRVTGGYYHFLEEIKENTVKSFYLDSDFMPCHRWEWADGIVRINHCGWFADDIHSEVVRGVVFFLSHGRFLAGCSFAEGMYGFCERRIFDDKEECASYSDELARVYAEICYEESLESNNDLEN